MHCATEKFSAGTTVPGCGCPHDAVAEKPCFDRVAGDASTAV